LNANSKKLHTKIYSLTNLNFIMVKIVAISLNVKRKKLESYIYTLTNPNFSMVKIIDVCFKSNIKNAHQRLLLN